MASLGYVPVQLVMATSVYALGVVGGIGAMFKSISRGEIPELTSLIYGARENCLQILAAEATKVGGEMVVGNRLNIRELSPGLIEVVAIGTAVKKAQGFAPRLPQLPPQAIIVDRMSEDLDSIQRSDPSQLSTTVGNLQRVRAGGNAAGSLIAIGCALFWVFGSMCIGILTMLFKQGS